MSAHAQRAHAKLSPSAAHRWWHCPGSIKASEGIENRSSSFADEGTAAHTLAEHCLLGRGYDAAKWIGCFVDLESGKIIASTIPRERCIEITEEMADAVQVYLDHVRQIIARPGVEYEVEAKLDLRHIPGMEFGTGDFCAYDEPNRTLYICDYKHGKGVPVEVDDNPQLLAYAIGVAARYHNRGVKKVVLAIIQPRAPHPKGPVRTWECSAIDLLDFEADLTEAATRTFAADAAINPGEWCKFCPAAPVCPALAAESLKIAQASFDVVTDELELTPPDALTPEQLGETLTRAGILKDWIKRVEEFAHHEATHGRCPKGFKLVMKRATRKWKDYDLTLQFFGRHGVKEGLWKEPELKSPAELERLAPGKNKTERAAAIEGLVSKESSGTTLAPENDPRPAARSDVSVFSE